jgi:acetyl-CoA acetyltransferase
VPAAQGIAASRLEPQSIRLVELNEAFAVQSLAVLQDLGLSPDITNANGGAIASAIPLAAQVHAS